MFRFQQNIMAVNLKSGGFDAILTFKVQLLSKYQKLLIKFTTKTWFWFFKVYSFFQNVMFWIGSLNKDVFDNFWKSFVGVLFHISIFLHKGTIMCCLLYQIHPLLHIIDIYINYLSSFDIIPPSWHQKFTLARSFFEIHNSISRIAMEKSSSGRRKRRYYYKI